MKKQQDNRELFESMPVGRAVRTMALPTILGQLIILVYSMADTYFIGRTNDPAAVAGASLILPVFNLALSISGLTGTGGGALISRLLGQKDPENAGRVNSFSVLFSVLVAGLFSLGTFVFMEPLLKALGAGSAVFPHARDYALWVIVAGGIPTVMVNVYSSLLRSVGASRPAAFGVMMGGVLNIVLDPLFMFVLLPEGMEIFGAGVATFLSNVISAVYFLVVVRRLGPDSPLRHPLRDLPERHLVWEVLKVGIPAATTAFLFDMDYVVIGRLMAGHGDTALAAIGIVLKVERLPQNIIIGAAMGMMPIIAYNYGAKNFERMDAARRYTLNASLILGAVSTVLYFALAPSIMRLFIAEPQTVAVGSVFLRIRAAVTTLMAMCVFHVFLFNGMGRGGYALFLGVTRWAVLNIPMLFVMDRFFGMNGIAASQFTGDIPMFVISLVLYRRLCNKLIRERQTDAG
ncbi:MAG: MATE family efflux transporter [Clostridia bacterium]|nr:MATE family efflux transporter [Clostridia bacterium]